MDQLPVIRVFTIGYNECRINSMLMWLNQYPDSMCKGCSICRRDIDSTTLCRIVDIRLPHYSRAVRLELYNYATYVGSIDAIDCALILSTQNVVACSYIPLCKSLLTARTKQIDVFLSGVPPMPICTNTGDDKITYRFQNLCDENHWYESLVSLTRHVCNPPMIQTVPYREKSIMFNVCVYAPDGFVANLFDGIECESIVMQSKCIYHNCWCSTSYQNYIALNISHIDELTDIEVKHVVINTIEWRRIIVVVHMFKKLTIRTRQLLMTSQLHIVQCRYEDVSSNNEKIRDAFDATTSSSKIVLVIDTDDLTNDMMAVIHDYRPEQQLGCIGRTSYSPGKTLVNCISRMLRTNLTLTPFIPR